jgi:hypothetical protein
VVAVVSAAVLVGAGAGFGGWYLAGRDGNGTPTAAATTSPTATTGASPSESVQSAQGASASPSPSEPPPGYRSVSEGEFDIVVPEGWQQRTEPGENGATKYYYEKPGGEPPSHLLVFKVTEPGATPLGTLETAEKDLVRAKEYRRIDLGPVPDPRGEAAELAYSYQSEKSGAVMRSHYRVIHADETQLYGVLATGPAEAYPEQSEILDTAADSFCLGGGC